MKPQTRRELSDREIVDLLTPRERPTPPAGLAERIKQEIPEDLALASDLVETQGSDVSPLGSRMSNSRIWLMAASVLVAVGGGFLALRSMDEIPPPGAAPVLKSDMESVSTESLSTEAVSTDPVSAEPAPAPEAAGRRDNDVGSTLSSESSLGGEIVPDDSRFVDPSVTESSGTESPLAEAPAPGSSALADEAPAIANPVEEPKKQRASSPPSSDKVVLDDFVAASAMGSTREEAEKQVGDSSSRSRQQELKKELAAIAQRQESAEMEASAEIVVTANRPVVSESPPPPLTTSPPQADVMPKSPVPPAMMAPPPPPPSPPARAAPPPPAPSRPREIPKPTASRRHENWRVEDGNARIRSMEREARQLEAELKALEEEPSPAAPTPAPPSTGGTAEPNDAPYGDVFFDSAGTNPFIDTDDDALSTFGLDVDTGSYTVARRYLRDGHLPPPEAVRVEEFLNYFDYGDTAPDDAEFALHAEGAPSIYGEGERYYLLRFNLSGQELADEDRKPALLTFVVDVSGSMGRENRIGLVQKALALLIDQLRPDDRLALVTYGSHGEVVLEPTSDHSAIRRAIARLSIGGSTNASEGLELAYELAARHRRRGAINRVILCSDGVANVGATSAGSILERIRHEADQGIELTTVGFGMGNYNDTLMEQLADTGNGRYAYVDTLDEARRIFVENLTGTLQTLAAEARAQVEFDPQIVTRYRLLGYENRDIADERFRDDTVDAGEIGFGHKVTALYEIKTERPLRDRDRVAVLRLRYGSVARGEMVELERAVTGADFVRRWQAASPALKLTSLVTEYAEILKRSYWAREGDLEDVFRRAQRLSAAFEGDREVADFISLVGRAAEYRQRETR